MKRFRIVIVRTVSKTTLRSRRRVERRERIHQTRPVLGRFAPHARDELLRLAHRLLRLLAAHGNDDAPEALRFAIRLQQERRPPKNWLITEILDTRYAFAGDTGNDLQ